MPKYRVGTTYRRKLQAELMTHDDHVNKKHTRGLKKSERQSAKKTIRKEIQEHGTDNS